MSAIKSAVTTRIKSTSEQCFYTYCYRHVLKLAVGYMASKESTWNVTFNTVSEILLNIFNYCLLEKTSPKQGTHIKIWGMDKKVDLKGTHTFCPVHWTVRDD